MRRTKILSLLLVAILLATPVAAATTFTDVPAGHWAAQYIAYAAESGLVNGIGDGTFAPEATLTEAQCCQITYKANGGTATGNPWYAPAKDFIESRTGTSINPDNTASRLFVCELLHRLSGGVTVQAATTQFSDCTDLPVNQQAAVNYCAKMGFVAGFPDGTFHPHEGLTRAQGAKIFVLWYQTALQSYATIKAANDMQTYAASLGLISTVLDWPGREDSTAIWRGLRIPSPEGEYTFVVGGVQVGWFAKLDSEFGGTDADGVKEWLMALSARLTDEQKMELAAKSIIDYGENLAIVMDKQQDSGTVWIVVPNSSPYLCYSVSLQNGALALTHYKDSSQVTATANEIYAELSAYAAGYPFTVRVQLAAEEMATFARNNGWTNVTTYVWPSSDDTYWYGLEANGPHGQFVFVIGGKAGQKLGWFVSGNGLTAMDRQSVRDSLSAYGR